MPKKRVIYANLPGTTLGIWERDPVTDRLVKVPSRVVIVKAKKADTRPIFAEPGEQPRRLAPLVWRKVPKPRGRAG